MSTETLPEELGHGSYTKDIHDYKLMEVLGEGSFGRVWKAIDKHSYDVVAIKELKVDFKCSSWIECLNLREVQAFRGLDHPNIVNLKQVIMENNVLYLVMEYMNMTLTQLMMKMPMKKLDNDQVRVIAMQLFKALNHMHGRGYFHCDLKPDNILISEDVVKVADFGMSRKVSNEWEWSKYVTTLWYRAPEVLLMAETYGPAVDMWAMGIIMAELFTLKPLFRGSSPVAQMLEICRVIGNPTKETWPEGLQRTEEVLKYESPMHPNTKFQFLEDYDGADKLAELVPNADEDAISLIRWLCSWDDRKRPTALEALQHPFFASHYTVPKSIVTRGPRSRPASSAKRGNSRRHELYSY